MRLASTATPTLRLLTCLSPSRSPTRHGPCQASRCLRQCSSRRAVTQLARRWHDDQGSGHVSPVRQFCRAHHHGARRPDRDSATPTAGRLRAPTQRGLVPPRRCPCSFGRRCPAISHAASPSARIVKLDFRPVRDRDYRTNPAPNYRRQCQIDVPPIKADKSQCYACWQHPLPPGRSSPTPANPRSAESIASLIATLMSLMRPACQCTIDIDSHQHSSPEQRRQGQETKGRS
jgi:hypothetical protein